ncbi:MAG: hypothetical protein K6B41_11475, partial [Butyrivibrio sp.]|nr:hypothetical protein [Butyrivibrio sp.]
SHAEGLYVKDLGKGIEIRDFKLEYGDGAVVDTLASLDESGVIIRLKSIRQLAKPVKIRYCYGNTFTGGLIYNEADLPMSPFREDIR